LSAHN